METRIGPISREGNSAEDLRNNNLLRSPEGSLGLPENFSHADDSTPTRVSYECLPPDTTPTRVSYNECLPPDSTPTRVSYECLPPDSTPTRVSYECLPPNSTPTRVSYECLPPDEDYRDPSAGYEIISRDAEWFSHLDNSEALLRQLEALGIRVEQEYLTLDIDASLSNSSSGTDESSPDGEMNLDEFDHEIVEAELRENECFKAVYEELVKNYKSPLNLQRDFQEYLRLVQEEADEDKGCSLAATGKVSREDLIRALKQKLDKFTFPSALRTLSSKFLARLERRKDSFSFDATTPDSGVHENFVSLSSEEQEKQRIEWKAELAKTEDEIQTLRQVLASKVKHAQDLKRRLGITIWREFSEDLTSSFRYVKESQPYQKTAGAMNAVSEKTGGIFGGIGAKFGQLKENPTYKSFEDKVGSAYNMAKSKVTGTESNSTQDFEDALREAEENKMASDNVSAETGQTGQTGQMGQMGST